MSDYTELKRLAEAISQKDIADPIESTRVMLVEPKALLALIAENDRLKTLRSTTERDLAQELEVWRHGPSCWTCGDTGDVHDMVGEWRGQCDCNAAKVIDVASERDQIKAENERLSTENSEIESAAITYIEDMQEAQRENARLTELFTVGMTLDGNLRVYGDWQSVRKAQEILAERDQLRAEVSGLRTGYEAYEQVNAELKAENERLERNRDMWKGQVERQAEELTALREEVTEWKDTVKFNEGCWSEERGTMIDKLQESRMRIKELDLLFGRYILAMRAAVIEEEHGLGAEGAMMWIYNSLAGPGELPPEGETDSQAYFDREIIAVDDGMQEVMAFHDGRRAALGQGEQS